MFAALIVLMDQARAARSTNTEKETQSEGKNAVHEHANTIIEILSHEIILNKFKTIMQTKDMK